MKWKQEKVTILKQVSLYRYLFVNTDVNICFEHMCKTDWRLLKSPQTLYMRFNSLHTQQWWSSRHCQRFANFLWFHTILKDKNFSNERGQAFGIQKSTVYCHAVQHEGPICQQFLHCTPEIAKLLFPRQIIHG